VNRSAVVPVSGVKAEYCLPAAELVRRTVRTAADVESSDAQVGDAQMSDAQMSDVQISEVQTSDVQIGAGSADPAADRRDRRLYLPTLAIAALAAWLGWRGASELSGFGVARSIAAGRFELAGPVVLGFVLVMFAVEQARPAVRRPLLARGHLVDMCYLLTYALVVVPLIVLIGAGFSGELARLAPWLAIPRIPGVPGWCFVALAVIAIDFVDWLAHLGNHRINSLWRLHAVHHSQEELSILTTFRAHPLVHVSFLISAIPILAISSNATTPTVVLTVYACLGALPHANVRWTYGRLGRVVISPAYHRIHHAATGRIDINLGTVLAIWDALSRRAVFPVADSAACPTGLSGRPVPVEQETGRPGLTRTFLTQWVEPFTATRKVPSR
jgi:sterol desaturase/sphingolipid hydroxylase (fatty acid hydroxylase superfamily)